MIKLIKVIFIFFILILNNCFAQQDATKRPYLTIEDPKIKPLKDLHKGLIIKSAIKIVMKSQKYQLIFSSPKSFEDAKFEFHKLEMKGYRKKFGKNKKGYTLHYFLFDARTKKVIKEVKMSYVENRHLVYKSKLLLYELFFGKDKALELEEELKKEAEREIQAELKREGLNNPRAYAKGINVENEKLELGDEDERKKKEDLLAEEAIKKAIVKKKRKPRLRRFEAPDLDLRKEEFDAKVDPPINFKVYSEFSYSLGYSAMTITSKSIIDVENNLRMIGVSVSAAVQLEENSLNRVHLGFSLNKITSENLFAVSAPKIFHLLYDFGSRNSFIRFQGGLEFETQSFANLGTAGEGIKAWDGSFLWLKAGAILEFSAFNRQFGFGGYFYSPFAGTSNFNVTDSEIILTGSKFALYGIGQVWKNWHVQVGLNRSKITSDTISSLENTHSILTINAIYK